MSKLSHGGKIVGTIPVFISYRIIELFSGGLYSSPNKALEELVSNSYDALASNVHVIVPPNLETTEAIIWVIDDGESMDAAGLVDLWQIAATKKRTPGAESTARPPIGRFGIGKLATYVLARELTYVCKAGGTYRAVTMDFGKIDPATQAETPVALELRELTDDEARALLGAVAERRDTAGKAIPLFGQGAPSTWTVAAMGNLTALAQKLTPGRLVWVLSTALPLSPKFTLFFNGEELRPSRAEIEPLRQWTIGKDDAIADKLKLAVHAEPPSVEIPGVGPVSGIAAIYADPLTGGKAEKMGRSHGVFVTVRKRLINLDDALFGLPQLSHGPFARFRMEVAADGLDEYLRATREAVLESDGVMRLRQYIQEKFNEVRAWYDGHEQKLRLAPRIGTTPQSLSRRPLVAAIRAVVEGSVDRLLLTKVPTYDVPSSRAAFLQRLEADLESETGLIKDVQLAALGWDRPIVEFDAASGILRVNILHPFYANYAEHYRNAEPFELLAVAEVLTEAYMLEEGLSEEEARRVLLRRDRFLRELVFSRQLAAPVVAGLLRDSVGDNTGLERAVAEAYRSLGFEVSPIGGKGKPDGVAVARLGFRDESGITASYAVTYDAKSTGGRRIAAHTVGAATIARHRDDYNAQFAVVVAPGFDGDGTPGSAALVEATSQGITLMTVEDLMRLVLTAATRQLGLTRIRNLFETCRGPLDVKKWIDGVLAEPVQPGPLPEILDVIWQLQRDRPDPVRASQIPVARPSLNRFRVQDIKDWLESVRRLAGGYLTFEGEVVSLEVPPATILREVRVQTSTLPEIFLKNSMLPPLGPADDPEPTK